MPDLDERFRSLSAVRTPDLWQEIEVREPGPQPRSPRRWPAVVVAFAVAVAGLTFAVSTFRSWGGNSTPTTSVTNGRIAFSGFDGTSWNIYSIEPDGTGLIELTHFTDEVAEDPAWSPDGERLAFVVQGFNENGTTDQSDIWVMNADGSDPRRVTDGPGSSWTPAWSPDGTRIAFARGDPSNLYVIGADGSGLTKLTTLSAGDESASDPSWSPDGSQIVFSPSGEVEKDLFVVNADGSGERPLLQRPGWQIEPTWSPDGHTIVFASSDPEGSGFGIDAIGADGANLRTLTDQPAAQAPSWSPDGRQIVFMATQPGSTHDALYVMNADGSDVRPVPGLPKEALFPSWQPVVEPTTSPPPLGTRPSPAETAAPSPIPQTDIGQPIDVGEASALMYAAGSVWVDTLRDAGTSTGTVLRIDPDSGEVLARIPVDAYEGAEHGGGGMAFDGRFVWIAGTRWSKNGPEGGILVRVDPETDTAETIDLPVGLTDIDLVFDDGFLWTTGATSPAKDPRVLQIDPSTGGVVSQTPIDAEWWGGLVVEDGAIWVMEMSVRNSTVQGDATLVRLEPGTGAVLASVPAVDENGVMGSTTPTSAGGAIWLPTGSELLELDPQTGDVLSRSDLGVGGDFELSSDGSLWCLCGFGWNELERLNPSTGEVDVTAHLEAKPIPVALAVTPDSVWVLTYDGTLTRVALS